MRGKKYKVKVISLPRVNEMSEEDRDAYLLQCAKHIKPENSRLYAYYEPITLEKIKKLAETIESSNLSNLYDYKLIKQYVNAKSNTQSSMINSSEKNTAPLSLNYNYDYYKFVKSKATSSC